MKKSEVIIAVIISELIERKGFDNFWYSTDKETRDEMIENWTKLIEEVLEPTKPILAAKGLKLGDMNIEFGKKEED